VKREAGVIGPPKIIKDEERNFEMKKQIKLLVLVLSLALMIGAMVGINVAAEEGEVVSVEQPKIVSKSVYYGDQVYLYYAVNNSALAEGQELELLLYVEDPTVNSEAVAYKAEISDREYTPNPSYPVYKSFGIPAKAVGDTVYAVAHIVGTEISYNNMVAYSVAEYCMEMLYTTTPSAAKAKLYNALLDYGEAAQEAFEHNTDKYLLSNLAYAYVKGGTFDGAKSKAIFDVSADAAARTITPAIEGFAYVNVTSYSADGAATTTKVVSGSSVVVTGHTVITPAGQILSVNDRRAEDGDAVNNANVMTLDFTVSYSEVTLGDHMNLFDMLDENGNVINSFKLYAQNYGGEARIRPYHDASAYLSGANVGNTLNSTISIRVTYNWTTGEMHVYTNGNEVSYTFADFATENAVKFIRFSDLRADGAYTISFTRFDIQ